MADRASGAVHDRTGGAAGRARVRGALVANFCGGLLTQNGDAVTDTFHQTDEALGLALAVARIGVLVSLVVIALADRLGRRKLILFSLAGACIANAIAGSGTVVRSVHRRATLHPGVRERVPGRRRYRRRRGGA